MTDKIEQQLDVVGLNFRMKRDVREVFASTVKKQRKGIRVDLQREPDNKYDPNAIMVVVADAKAGALDGHHLGYVRRESAEVLAPRMDEGDLVVDSAFLVALYADDDNKSGLMECVFEVER